MKAKTRRELKNDLIMLMVSIAFGALMYWAVASAYSV